MFLLEEETTARSRPIGGWVSDTDAGETSNDVAKGRSGFDGSIAVGSDTIAAFEQFCHSLSSRCSGFSGGARNLYTETESWVVSGTEKGEGIRRLRWWFGGGITIVSGGGEGNR